MVVCLSFLTTSLNKLRKDKLSLSHGVMNLFTIFGIFTLGLVLRMVYNYVVNPELDFPNFFSSCALPLMWECLPIFLMQLYHLRSFEQMRRTRPVKLKKAIRERLDTYASSVRSMSGNSAIRYGSSDQPSDNMSSLERSVQYGVDLS